MENIISLSNLITKQKIYQAELIDELDGKENKMAQLYNNIINGNINSDEDALKILYKNKGNIGKLNKLKSRLYQRLINSLFFLDQSGSNYADVFEAAKNCYKNFAAVKLLLGNRRRDVAIDLAKRTLKISKKYEFTDLNYLLTSILSTHYVSYTLDPISYAKYKKLKNYYFEALQAENDAEEIYGEFSFELSKSSKGLTEEDLIKYGLILKDLREMQARVTTLNFNLRAYLFQANFYLENKEYHKIVEIASEGLKFFGDKGVQSKNVDYTLRTRAAIAHFMLKNYNKAESLYKENLEMTSPNTGNWYATYNFLFSLKIIQKKYQDAFDILTKIFNTKEFETIAHPLLVQLWKIKEAYIHFLIEMGKVNPEESVGPTLRKFRFARFMNDTPTFSKDKRGVNISILIIQMVLLVQNKQYDMVIDKLDALNMYCHRYLRNDSSFRSNCFIKMLAKLPDADYHPIRWVRYVQKLRERLDEQPFELSYHNLDMEVIPFERLYDLVIEMLERK